MQESFLGSFHPSMTPEQKLRIALRLYYSARELKEAALRRDHPNWTETEIQEKVRGIFLNARTWARLFFLFVTPNDLLNHALNQVMSS